MQYRVNRIPAFGHTIKMCRGLGDGPGNQWTEARFLAEVIGPDGQVTATVYNSTLLCLPRRSVRAPFATDEEILGAVLNNESVF